MSLDGLQFVHEALCRRQAGYDMGISVSPFPYGSFIAAGVSIGLLGATFENMLNVVYRRKTTLTPSDDELCPYCSGFGSVRCEVCNSRGALFMVGTTAERLCPVCEGKKRERCRRCAGSGTTGMKKSASTPPTRPNACERQLRNDERR